MKILSVFDPEFASYGAVLEGYDFSEMIDILKTTEFHPGEVLYRPSHAALEATAAAKQLQQHYYGDMPIQVGICNSQNTTLNCLEYHRDDEINVCATDIILLLAKQEEMENFTIDTSKVKAFLAPAGTAVMLRSSALHYAPCHVGVGNRFYVAIVLPRNTNTDMPIPAPKCQEDKLLWARNKWLMAHPDAPEAAQGAYVGLTGKNITID